MFIFTEKFDTIEKDGLVLKISQKYPGDEEMLPFYYYDIIDIPSGETAGKISVRIGNNFHSYYNGHIGYEVFEVYRGRGIAAKACKIVLDVARFHGMTSIYLTCGESNAASKKTIERHGAEFVECATVPKEYFAWREGMEKQIIYTLEL